jgi:hypothetical protein
VGVAAVDVSAGAAADAVAARVEPWLVAAVALHSVAVGLGLLAAPGWALRFGGWEAAAGGTLFFVRQGGAFHLAVATGYLLEYAHHRGVVLLCCTKALATVFLATMTLAEPGAWVVPFSALADASMGVAVLAVHRRAAAARG